MSATTQTILRQVEALGYAVSVHHISGTVVRDDGTGKPLVIPGSEYVEMHAVRLSDPDEQHVARCVEGDGEEEAYRTACALAEMVGMRLEG